ncbi:NUDIX hydrolase [Candidatus Daviesbacteria bacterium]|nr:NUDIX hydrolase [Candidatus Daviesbacteria bacterium]
MEKKKLKKAVIFIFLKDRKVLVEKRIRDAEKILKNQLIFPGGGLEEKDFDDLEVALKREIFEELGVSASKFSQLAKGLKIISAGKDASLHPFIIEAWENEIPEKILDKDVPLFWVDIEVMLESKIAPTKKIAELVKDYLENV